MRRRSLLVAGLGLLTLSACSSEEPTAGIVVRFAPDKRKIAPAISGDLLGGGSYKLADQLGKVVVINFWASWCPPCRLEAAALESVYKANRLPSATSGQPTVEFLGINIRDDRDKAVAFHEGKATYPSIFDPAGRIALEFSEVGPNTTPATLIIDQKGRIAAVIRKAVQADELQPIVAEIVAEAAA